MGDMLRRHPEYFIPDPETGFLKVASGCCAYSDVFRNLDYPLKKTFKFSLISTFSW
jgi:hypothetical protein